MKLKRVKSLTDRRPVVAPGTERRCKCGGMIGAKHHEDGIYQNVCSGCHKEYGEPYRIEPGDVGHD